MTASATRGERREPTGWRSLTRPARAWRIFHAAWSVAQLVCLAYIWACAATRRRGPMLGATVAFLVIEGGALVAGRGNCPMGPLQEEWGDPVPFFELLLPRRAAKAAIPALTVVSVAAIAAVIFRRPRRVVAFGPPA